MQSQDGNNRPGDPWRSGAASNSNLKDLVRQGEERFKNLLPSGSPTGRGFIILAALVVLALGAWTSYYTVPSDSVAVVQRFGKYSAIVLPGLHFKLPLGIDTATIVPVKRQLKQEFGFATPGATDPFQSPGPRDAKRETEMVTGDLNAALVEWVVHTASRIPPSFSSRYANRVKPFATFQNPSCARSSAIAPWTR